MVPAAAEGMGCELCCGPAAPLAEGLALATAEAAGLALAEAAGLALAAVEPAGFALAAVEPAGFALAGDGDAGALEGAEAAPPQALKTRLRTATVPISRCFMARILLLPGRSILPRRMIAFQAPTESGSQRRVDGNLKVTGAMPYAADLQIEGALHVAVVRSSRPHARIL